MVSDIHVARLQHVDGPRICRSLAIVLYSLLLNHFFNIGPSRHPNRGQRPAHQYLVRMNAIPAVFVLVIEARSAKRRPCFLEGDILHPIQNVIGHLGPSVGKPFSVQ